jgi:hypothetical protein
MLLSHAAGVDGSQWVVGNHPPLQHVKTTQGQKPCHHCADTDNHKNRKTEFEHDETNIVTRYWAILTEEEQVNEPKPPLEHIYIPNINAHLPIILGY